MLFPPSPLLLQLPRNAASYVQLVYFNPGDSVDAYLTVPFPLVSPSAPLVGMQLAQLNGTFAVIVYRNPNSNYQLSASLLSVTGTTSVTVWPAVMISPGSPQFYGLNVSIAAVAADRVVVSYQDAFNNAYIVDAGIFGTSVVLGRSQLVYRGTNYTSNFTSVCAIGTTSVTVAVVSQPGFTYNAKAANFFVGTPYGEWLPERAFCGCGRDNTCVCVCVCT